MASHSLLRWLLENDQRILPRNPQMLRQFMEMRFEQSRRTATIENADASTHDDVPDAAALAMLPYPGRPPPRCTSRPRSPGCGWASYLH